MRLLKLAAYALLGYALYEFVRGMINDEAAAGGGSFGRAGGGGEQQFSEAGAAQNITGPGEGEDVQTEEPDGGMMRYRVGRGVVR